MSPAAHLRAILYLVEIGICSIRISHQRSDEASQELLDDTTLSASFSSSSSVWASSTLPSSSLICFLYCSRSISLITSSHYRLLILALIPFLKHMIWYSILFKEIPYGNSFLASLFRISLPERFNVFTTCCHNQYKLVRRKGIQYISNHQNRGWMLTLPVEHRTR